MTETTNTATIIENPTSRPSGLISFAEIWSVGYALTIASNFAGDARSCWVLATQGKGCEGGRPLALIEADTLLAAQAEGIRWATNRMLAEMAEETGEPQPQI